MKRLAWTGLSLALVGALAALALGFGLRGASDEGRSASAGQERGAPAAGVGIENGVLTWTSDASVTALAAAAVGSFEELESSVGPDTTVIVLDSVTLSAAPDAFLRDSVAKGIAIVAVDVGIVDLRERTNFVGLVDSFMEPYAENVFEPKPLSEPGYSYVWTENGYVSSGQGVLSDGTLDGRIEKLNLLSQGLTTYKGEIMTFDEYDRRVIEDTGGTHGVD